MLPVAIAPSQNGGRLSTCAGTRTTRDKAAFGNCKSLCLYPIAWIWLLVWFGERFDLQMDRRPKGVLTAQLRMRFEAAAKGLDDEGRPLIGNTPGSAGGNVASLLCRFDKGTSTPTPPSKILSKPPNVETDLNRPSWSKSTPTVDPPRVHKPKNSTPSTQSGDRPASAVKASSKGKSVPASAAKDLSRGKDVVASVTKGSSTGTGKNVPASSKKASSRSMSVPAKTSSKGKSVPASTSKGPSQGKSVPVSVKKAPSDRECDKTPDSTDSRKDDAPWVREILLRPTRSVSKKLPSVLARYPQGFGDKSSKSPTSKVSQSPEQQSRPAFAESSNLLCKKLFPSKQPGSDKATNPGRPVVTKTSATCVPPKPALVESSDPICEGKASPGSQMAPDKTTAKPGRPTMKMYTTPWWKRAGDSMPVPKSSPFIPKSDSMPTPQNNLVIETTGIPLSDSTNVVEKSKLTSARKLPLPKTRKPVPTRQAEPTQGQTEPKAVSFDWSSEDPSTIVPCDIPSLEAPPGSIDPVLDTPKSSTQDGTVRSGLFQSRYLQAAQNATGRETNKHMIVKVDGIKSRHLKEGKKARESSPQPKQEATKPALAVEMTRAKKKQWPPKEKKQATSLSVKDTSALSAKTKQTIDETASTPKDWQALIQQMRSAHGDNTQAFMEEVVNWLKMQHADQQANVEPYGYVLVPSKEAESSFSDHTSVSSVTIVYQEAKDQSKASGEKEKSELQDDDSIASHQSASTIASVQKRYRVGQPAKPSAMVVTASKDIKSHRKIKTVEKAKGKAVVQDIVEDKPNLSSGTHSLTFSTACNTTVPIPVQWKETSDGFVAVMAQDISEEHEDIPEKILIETSMEFACGTETNGRLGDPAGYSPAQHLYSPNQL